MDQTQQPQDDALTASDPGPRLDAGSVRDLHRLRRSHDDRYVAGIAGGLGRHLRIDPTIIRVLLVALCVVGGAGLLLYAVAWLIVPDEGHHHALVRLNDELIKIVLVSLAVIAVLSLVGSGWWWNGDHGVVWPLGIAALVAALVVSSSRRRHEAPSREAPAPPTPPAPAVGPHPPASTRPRRHGPVLFWPTIALIALGWGILGVWAADDHRVVAAAWPALALAITAVMLVLGAFVGRPGGLILLGFVLLPPLAISSVVGSVHWNTHPLDPAPTRSADVRDHYAISNGRLDLDLSRVQDAGSLAGRTITVAMNAGQLTVGLPRGVDTQVDASLGLAGEVEVVDRDESGFSPRVTELVQDGGGGLAPLVLDVHGRVGHINIERY